MATLPYIYRNLPRALTLIRELRGRSQAELARRAGIGKSQMSKYENGKELPKLDTLATVIGALEVDIFEFFYTVYLIDLEEARIAPKEAGMIKPPPLPLAGPGLLLSLIHI